MSSHREAPAISKDPVADNTDTYAFVSPDSAAAGTVTIITNYIPVEAPAGGPNFYEFGDDVLYEIKVDNNGDALPDVTFQFRFHTTLRNDDTFLYNTGPITTLDSTNWNRRQFYSVTMVTSQGSQVLASGLKCPPCNIGPRSTPDYASLGMAAVHNLGGGVRVFAGQRAEGFFVDLGSIFDLGALRPVQELHLLPLPSAAGVNATRQANVHCIAIQVPISMLTRDGSTPHDPLAAHSVLGIWGAASRRRVSVRADDDDDLHTGPFVQVSRLGNPLFNEVITPMADKDRWNAVQPSQDAQFLKYVQHPELARLLLILYPGVFPHLAGLTAARADLVAVLMTGIPAGIVPGFQNFTGSTVADMLRLNVAIPATDPASANPLGLVAGDAAGFPNGRRVIDDVVTIEVRAIAGLTYKLVNPSYKPDDAIPLVTDGLTIANSGVSYLDHFPYLGVPHDGFNTPSA